MELIIWLLHQGISIILRSFSMLIPAADIKSKMIVSDYLQVFSNILCIFAFRKYLYCFSPKNILSKKNIRICLYAILAGIGICLAHRLIFLLFPQIGMTMLPQMDYVRNIQKYYYSPAIFTYAILWAPISEEILSRGIIFTVAQKKHGNVYAITISAFLFALAHYNLPQFFSALCLGLLIGYFAVLTNNVYIGVIIHVANNMYASIREMILGDKIWEMSQKDFFINAIMGIFILLFSIFMINYETHNLAKRQKIDFRES